MAGTTIDNKDNNCWCLCGCTSNQSAPSCPQADCPQGEDCGDCNCLYFCDITVLAKHGVGPCNETGSLDIYSVSNECCACLESPTFHVLSYDESLLSNIDIDSEGILSWTTTGDPETAGEYTEIQVKAKCFNKDGICLEYIFCVTIGIKDLCLCVDCDEKCTECDPCTGECVDVGGEISVTCVSGGEISVT